MRNNIFSSNEQSQKKEETRAISGKHIERKIWEPMMFGDGSLIHNL